MIVIYPRTGQPIQIPNGAAVRHATLPRVTEAQEQQDQPPALSLEVLSASGTVLAVFRSKHLAGWDVSAAGTDS